MKYEAVIFDLFGTLIENLPEPEYRFMLSEVASALSANRDRFADFWNQYSDDLFTGTRQIEECLGLVCARMGLTPGDGRLSEAYGLMAGRVKLKLEPPGNSLELLAFLKKENYRVGLISNCSNEVPALWKDSPLASFIQRPIFSCSIGLKKPDPRIYLLAAEQLHAAPDKCLFIDDNLEPLEGASKLGMKAVLIQDVRLNKSLVDSNGWKGHIISSVGELVHLLK